MKLSGKGARLFCALLLCSLLFTGLNAQQASGKWGALDTYGKVVVPFVYDKILGFSDEGYAIAYINGKQGIIDKQGKVLVPVEYDDIRFYSAQGLAQVMKGKVWGIVNLRGQTIVPMGHSGLRRINTLEKIVPIMVNNQIQLLDYSGKILHAPKGTYEAYSMLGNGLLSFSKVGISGWGIMNFEGKILAPAGKYDIVEGVYAQPAVRISKCADRYACKYGLLNTAGVPVTQVVYDDIKTHEDQGIGIIARKGDKWGTMDAAGKALIPFKYSMLTYIANGYHDASVTTGNQTLYGVVLDNGKEIIPCKYEKSTTFFPEEGVGRMLDQDYMYALCDETGKALTGFDYDEMHEPSEGMISAVKGIKCGFLDRQGKEVTPFVYSEVLPFSQKVASVKKDQKWGVIDNTGAELIPFGIYDRILPFKYGVAVVQKGTKCGAIDKSGEVIIPLQYTQMQAPHQGVIITQK